MSMATQVKGNGIARRDAIKRIQERRTAEVMVRDYELAKRARNVEALTKAMRGPHKGLAMARRLCRALIREKRILHTLQNATFISIIVGLPILAAL